MIPVRPVLILLLLFATAVEARMYQWTDPDTGTTQFSGKPPSWYRSGEGGPRVFVFERNSIIDDTGIEVSVSERENLRRNAFVKAEEDRLAAQQKALAAEELKSTLKEGEEVPAAEEDEAPVDTELAEVPPLVDEEPQATEPMTDDEQAVEQMRALIEAWEEQQTKQARERLELQDSGFSY